MAGRHAKPIDLHLQNGNKRHLTKAEIAARKNSEIKLGGVNLLCPAYIKNDVSAFSKWRELKHIFSGFNFVTSVDSGMIARFCMAHSEYIALLKQKNELENIQFNMDGLEDYIEDSEEFNFKIKKQLLKIVSVEGLLKIDNSINKKMEMLLKMEDRLFLNPLARIKSIAQKTKEAAADPNANMFGDG